MSELSTLNFEIGLDSQHHTIVFRGDKNFTQGNYPYHMLGGYVINTNESQLFTTLYPPISLLLTFAVFATLTIDLHKTTA